MLLAAITAFIDTNGNTTTSESVVLNADFYAAAIYAVTPVWFYRYLSFPEYS